MADKVKAVWDTLQQMKKNLECSICLELLKDPHSTKCNHQFCRQCINQVIEKGQRKVKNKCSCPLCKTPVSKRSLTPNPQLNKIVVAVRHLCDAVQKDTGVAGSPPSLSITSSSISGTPGCLQFHDMHPTPQKTGDEAERHQVSVPGRSTTKDIDPGRKSGSKDQVQIFIEYEANSDGQIHGGNQVISNTNICTSFPSVETSKNTRKSKSVKQSRRLRRTQRKPREQRETKAPEDNKELLRMIDTMPLGVQATAETSSAGQVKDCRKKVEQSLLNKATTKARESACFQDDRTASSLSAAQEVEKEVGTPTDADPKRNEDLNGENIRSLAKEPQEIVQGCSTLVVKADSSLRSPVRPDLLVERMTRAGDTDPMQNTEASVCNTKGDASAHSIRDISQSVYILPSFACVGELDEKDCDVAVSITKGEASTDSTQDTSHSVSILQSPACARELEDDYEAGVLANTNLKNPEHTTCDERLSENVSSGVRRSEKQPPDTPQSVSILQSLANKEETDKEDCDVCLMEEAEGKDEREALHVYTPPACVSAGVTTERHEIESRYVLQENTRTCKNPTKVLESHRVLPGHEVTGSSPDVKKQFNLCSRDGSSLRTDRGPENFGEEFTETAKHRSYLQDGGDSQDHKVMEIVQLTHSYDKPANLSPEDTNLAGSPDMYEKIKMGQRRRASDTSQASFTKRAFESVRIKRKKRSQDSTPDISQNSANFIRSLSKKLRNSSSPCYLETNQDAEKGSDTRNSEGTDSLPKDSPLGSEGNSSMGPRDYQIDSNRSCLSSLQTSSSSTPQVSASVSSPEVTDISVIDPMVAYTSGKDSALREAAGSSAGRDQRRNSPTPVVNDNEQITERQHSGVDAHKDSALPDARGSSAGRDQHRNSPTPLVNDNKQMVESQPFLVTKKGQDSAPSPAKVDADDNLSWSPSSNSTNDGNQTSPSPRVESCRLNTPSQNPHEINTVTPCLFGCNDSCETAVELCLGKTGSAKTSTKASSQLSCETRDDLHEQTDFTKQGLALSEMALPIGETQDFHEHSETISDGTTQSVSLLLGLEIPDEYLKVHKKNDRETSLSCSNPRLLEDKEVKHSTKRVSKSQGFKSPQVKLNNSCEDTIATGSTVHMADLSIEGEIQDSDVIPPTPPILKCHNSQVPSKFQSRRTPIKARLISPSNPNHGINTPPSSIHESTSQSDLRQQKGRASQKLSFPTRMKKWSPDTSGNQRMVTQVRRESEMSECDLSARNACDAEPIKPDDLSGQPSSSTRVPEISEKHSERSSKTRNQVDFSSSCPAERNEIVCLNDDEEGMDENPLADHVLPGLETRTTKNVGGCASEKKLLSVQSKSERRRISCIWSDEDHEGSESDEDQILLKPVFLPRRPGQCSTKGNETREGTASQELYSCPLEDEEDDEKDSSRVSCSGQMTNRSAASSTFLSGAPSVSTQKVELLRKNVYEREEEIIALRALISDMEQATEAQSDQDDSQEDVRELSPYSPTSPPSSLTPGSVPPVTPLPSPVEAVARFLEEDASEDEEEEDKTEECRGTQKESQQQERSVCAEKRRPSSESDHDLIATKVCLDERESTHSTSRPQRPKRSAHDSDDEDGLIILDEQEPITQPAPSTTKRRRLVDDTGTKKSPVVSFLFRDSLRDAKRTPSPLASHSSRTSHLKRSTVLSASQDNSQVNTSSVRREEGQALLHKAMPLVMASRVSGDEENCAPAELSAKGQHVGRTFSFVATRLNRQQLNEVRSIAEAWGGKLAREFNSKTTHVVMATDRKMQVTRISYTMKYLLGLALGKWIVSHHWIAACFQAKSILPEEQYEVHGDPDLHQTETPRLARRARDRKDPLLFADFRVLCVGKFTSSVTKTQLTQLLDFCGAKVCQSASDMASYETFEKQHVLIADKSDREGVKRNRGLSRRFNLPPVSLEWVTDSIANYRIQDIEEYIIKA